MPDSSAATTEGWFVIQDESLTEALALIAEDESMSSFDDRREWEQRVVDWFDRWIKPEASVYGR